MFQYLAYQDLWARSCPKRGAFLLCGMCRGSGPGSRGANHVMLFRDGEARCRKGILNQGVGVEIDLPVIPVVAEGTYGEHGPRQIEGENLDARRRIGQHIRNLRKSTLEDGDRLMRVRSVRQLRRQLDAAKSIGRKVLDDVAEDLTVADDIADVVGGVDRGDEQPDLDYRAHDSAGHDEISHLEGLKNNEEHSCGEIAQQAAPRHADSYAGSGEQCGEAGGLDPEEAQDGNHQHDIQNGGESVVEVADQGRIDFLAGHSAVDQTDGKSDEPAAHDPQRNRFENLDAERKQQRVPL